MLRTTASVPANEKFKTQVTEMTVEAKQRLRALSTFHSGETVGAVDGRKANAVRGNSR